MKWGRKKKLSSPSSSPSSSIITRVLPVSWFSKLKRKSDENPETSSKVNKHRNAAADFFPTPYSKARFYSMDEDDPFWRLSFGEERINPARKSTGGLLNPVWYDSDHEFRFPVSGFKSETRRAKMSELERVSNSGERDVFPVEQEYMVQTKDDFSNLAVSNYRKQPEIPISGPNEDYEKRMLKEIKVKTKDKSRIKAYSPKKCKIRALEEMKKARMKMRKEKRKEMEQVVAEGKTVFNSFAVVKNSFDPQRDFRDSMVEMIREKGICRSEDLEELLACYLALNSDEYHDIIIKVFGKVWFELKGVQHFDY